MTHSTDTSLFEDLGDLFNELDETTADARLVLRSGPRAIAPTAPAPAPITSPSVTAPTPAAGVRKRPKRRRITMELTMDDIELSAEGPPTPPQGRPIRRVPPPPPRAARLSTDRGTHLHSPASPHEAKTKEIPIAGRLR